VHGILKRIPLLQNIAERLQQHRVPVIGKQHHAQHPAQRGAPGVFLHPSGDLALPEHNELRIIFPQLVGDLRRHPLRYLRQARRVGPQHQVLDQPQLVFLPAKVGIGINGQRHLQPSPTRRQIAGIDRKGAQIRKSFVTLRLDRQRLHHHLNRFLVPSQLVEGNREIITQSRVAGLLHQKRTDALDPPSIEFGRVSRKVPAHHVEHPRKPGLLHRQRIAVPDARAALGKAAQQNHHECKPATIPRGEPKHAHF